MWIILYRKSIENGNAPPLKKVVEGVETTIAPLTAEEKSQRRELDEQAIENWYGGNALLKRLEESSKRSHNSTNGAVNTTHGATTASTQATDVNSTIIDNLSDAVIRDGLKVADGKLTGMSGRRRDLEEHEKKSLLLMH
ncbi:hypothetical protein Tco_0489243 [Tanacetum coccineum]